jgi:hypothetical protein
MRRKYFHYLHHLPMTQIELKFKVKVEEEEEEIASRKGRYSPPVLSSRDISPTNSSARSLSNHHLFL